MSQRRNGAGTRRGKKAQDRVLKDQSELSVRFFELLRRDEQSDSRLTHNLFRYPAKFHPPVARALVELFSKPGQIILDPFCGSGTVAVEALVSGRDAIGIDVDPLAAALAGAKTKRLRPIALRRSVELVIAGLGKLERDADEYTSRQFKDLSAQEYAAAAARYHCEIPALENLEHWFRRYVVIDLARILRLLKRAAIPETHRRFLLVVFASIIRNSSNADPVPVSGLEVTAHMLRRDRKGRVINPFALFRRALAKALEASESFYRSSKPRHVSVIKFGSALDVLRSPIEADLVITSPPYHGAVDYYRRHTLEMYWLGLTKTREHRLRLLDLYIGRVAVPNRHPLLENTIDLPSVVDRWERKIRKLSGSRANGFRHYAIGMKLCFERLSKSLKANARAVFVVGNSRWQDHELPTDTLLVELAEDWFDLQYKFSYPLKNRYMSYSRHNGANIKVEHVLVLKRKAE